MAETLTDLLTEFLKEAHTLPGVETLTVCVERPNQQMTVAATGMADAALPLHLMHTALALLSNVDLNKAAHGAALREAVKSLRLACETEVAQALAKAGCPGVGDRRH